MALRRLTWSDANPSPSQKGDEHVPTFGDWRISFKSDLLKLECGSTSWELRARGLMQSGGGIEHDGKLIDKTHQSIDSMPGPAKTGVPEDGGI